MEHGTSLLKQLVQCYSPNSDENEKKRNTPAGIIFFYETFTVEKTVPFDFLPERPIFFSQMESVSGLPNLRSTITIKRLTEHHIFLVTNRHRQKSGKPRRYILQ